MVATHCLPSGSLGTAELPVPNVSTTTMTTVPGSGSKRGVAVLIHGLQTSIAAVPPSIPNTGGALPLKFGSLATALAADGWECLYVTFAEDWAVGIPAVALQSDIVADAGHGSRYLAQTLHWWDHVVAYIHATYGVWPIVPFGLSWGGWHVFQIMANRASTCTAFACHVSVTVLSSLAPAFTTPADFSAVNTTGLDTTSTMLNAVTKPGIIGWSTNDGVTPYLNIKAIYDTALAAGAPVTSNATTDNHSLTDSAVTTYTNWFASVVDPLAPAVH